MCSTFNGDGFESVQTVPPNSAPKCRFSMNLGPRIQKRNSFLVLLDILPKNTLDKALINSGKQEFASSGPKCTAHFSQRYKHEATAIDGEFVSWSLTSIFNMNTAISETKD